MGQEELRQQAETVTSIDSKVSVVGEKVSESTELLKKMWKLAPYIGGLCTLVGGIGGFAIGAYKYDANIVKQPQFSRAETRAIYRDSVLNAKIDTNNNRVNERIDNLPTLVVNEVTQHKDKDGNITYRNAN